MHAHTMANWSCSLLYFFEVILGHPKLYHICISQASASTDTLASLFHNIFFLITSTNALAAVWFRHPSCWLNIWKGEPSLLRIKTFLFANTYWPNFYFFADVLLLQLPSYKNVAACCWGLCHSRVPLHLVEFVSIIQIHNNVMWNWQYSIEYSL